MRSTFRCYDSQHVGLDNAESGIRTHNYTNQSNNHHLLVGVERERTTFLPTSQFYGSGRLHGPIKYLKVNTAVTLCRSIVSAEASKPKG